MRWIENIAWMGYRINAYKLWERKPEGKGLCGRYRHRWKDNIKMHLREIDVEGVNGFLWLRTVAGGGFL
jgi:hypothetical protein